MTMLLENLGKEMFLVRLHPFNGRQPKDDRPLTSYGGIARVFLSSVVLSVRLSEDELCDMWQGFSSDNFERFGSFCVLLRYHLRS